MYTIVIEYGTVKLQVTAPEKEWVTEQAQPLYDTIQQFVGADVELFVKRTEDENRRQRVRERADEL